MRKIEVKHREEEKRHCENRMKIEINSKKIVYI